MRIVQVCNVGNICGGTAACAWTISRVWPMCEQTVLFVRPPTAETVRIFAPVPVQTISYVDDAALRRFRPDLVILHNTAAGHVGRISCCLSVQYLHSMGNQAAADLRFACSSWLADQQREHTAVQYQPVPIPPTTDLLSTNLDRRHLDDEITIGRICTPTSRKWPDSLISFYEKLAAQFPSVRWEFVGCPEAMQPFLMTACRGRARFHAAGWSARRLLWSWHGMVYHHPQLTESFGRTVAEAMRAGCIPIVDHRGGFREQISSGMNGFLCTSESDFAESIAALLRADLRWTLARNAKTEASERFSLRAFATTFRQKLANYSITPSSRCSN